MRDFVLGAIAIFVTRRTVARKPSAKKQGVGNSILFILNIDLVWNVTNYANPIVQGPGQC